MKKENIIFCDVKPRKNLSGKRFDRLIAIEPVGKNKRNQLIYRCVCDCGVNLYVRQSDLSSGNTKSCGCKKIELFIKRFTTHGMTNTPEYKVWNTMKQRCHNENSEKFNMYGGRGITVCDRWFNSFENFFEDMGKKPFKTAQIDREDNNKGYTPDNCHWATPTENCRNRRSNRFIEYKGTKKTAAEWEEEIGMNHGTIFNRINRSGWSVEKALTTPIGEVSHSL